MQTTRKTRRDRNCCHPGKEADKLCLALNHQTSHCNPGLPHLQLQGGPLGLSQAGECQALSNSRRGRVAPPRPPSPGAASSIGTSWVLPLASTQHSWPQTGSGADTKHIHPVPELPPSPACGLQAAEGGGLAATEGLFKGSDEGSRPGG